MIQFMNRCEAPHDKIYNQDDLKSMYQTKRENTINNSRLISPNNKRSSFTGGNKPDPFSLFFPLTWGILKQSCVACSCAHAPLGGRGEYKEKSEDFWGECRGLTPLSFHSLFLSLVLLFPLHLSVSSTATVQ